MCVFFFLLMTLFFVYIFIITLPSVHGKHVAVCRMKSNWPIDIGVRSCSITLVSKLQCSKTQVQLAIANPSQIP